MNDNSDRFAEDAARLADAASAWLRRAATAAGPADDVWSEATARHAHEIGGQIATGGPECRLCPLCQLIGLFRNAQPEVAVHLLQASDSLLAALRAALDAHQRAWSGESRGGSTRKGDEWL